MECFEYKKFKDINLSDNFFDSLKKDYSEFENWFIKKATKDESAYTQTINNKIEGFLYLKVEKGPITDITPQLKDNKIIKIGTMKINPHGTRLGERFIKKSIDYAIQNDAKVIYVTVFDKHKALINMYIKYGFEEFGTKSSPNGTEKVLVKRLDVNKNDFVKDYPLINRTVNSYGLSIKPNFHTKLFPDSILKTEDFDIVRDVSHTNSIEKI
ncbi:GNAT family N-acetyltransferase, partial [Clostridium perfringens]|nr:GNAT family N-acetyltransferase [Clostridium perfringens]